jgi:hypothetical protein
MSGYPYNDYNGDPNNEQAGLVYNNSASFAEAYPLITYGKMDEYCRSDRECLNGLYCLGDPNTSVQTCQLPPEMDTGCSRSPSDARCHKITYTGQKVYCPDEFCPPIPPKQYPIPSAEQCANAQSYHHAPSHSNFCISINDTNGVPTLMPEKCCNPTMTWNNDVESEISKYSLSHQYYGIYR